MKSFIIKAVIFIFFALVPAPIIVIINCLFSSKIDWKLPSEKHILFVGASYIAFGIDDSLTRSAINLANGGERYMFTYIKLQHIIDNNVQIDTIFMECAPTDLFEHADDKYFRSNEMTEYYAKYYPLFNFEQWKLYKGKISMAFSLLFRKTIWDYITGIDYTYFISDSPPRTKTMKREKVHEELVTGKYGHKINYKYLRKIIQLCYDKHIKLYLLYSPVYKPEYYYNQNCYYDSYHKYFSDVELLDYSHFPMSDNERYDAHHLNDKGAIRFTNEIKKNFNIN